MTGNGQIRLSRCHDPQVLEWYLTGHYYDAPVCFFSRSLTAAAGRWLAKLQDVFFLCAEVNRQPAGYVLGHQYGPRLWRSFLLCHPRLFLHVALLALRMKRGLTTAQLDRLRHAIPRKQPERVRELTVPAVEQPFQWAAPNPQMGYVEMLYVCPEFRGRGIAVSLLQTLCREMEQVGITRIEAHVDATNYGSLQAVLRAGWSAVRTRDGDLLVSHEVDNES